MSNRPREANTTPNGPSRLSEAIGRVDWGKSDQIATIDQEEREAAARARREAEAAEASRRLWSERGARYRDCALSNFAASTEAQQKVRSRLRAFAENLAIQPAFISGLVLIGPPGTGKDHLMAALMHVALMAKLTVKWASGLGLFRRLRDAIDEHHSETVLLRSYLAADILAISDPTWERKPLTDWQQQRLGEIVDERWNNCRPIWVTINAAGPEDAERMLGHAMVDRLRDGALSLVCDWPSYRKSKD